jgi:hypothetical protein
MKKLVLFAVVVFSGFAFFSCEDADDIFEEPTVNEPKLIVRFKFDPTQVRLNNLGQPAGIPSENAAQTPIFSKISAHYLEFSPTATTQLGDGTVLYHASETDLGGSTAIDFGKAIIVSENEAFLEIPLKNITPGNYEWARCSLSYQNYKISIRHQGNDYEGTLSSFVGFNTYINSHLIGNNIFPVNGNRLQGYWAFALNDFPYSTSGQAPANATTVPNPLAATSQIPAGSCVVTGKFPSNLVITGNETKNIIVTLSLSINNSFEWSEVINDGKFEPSQGENVVDMGLRGLIPTYTN